MCGSSQKDLLYVSLKTAVEIPVRMSGSDGSSPATSVVFFFWNGIKKLLKFLRIRLQFERFVRNCPTANVSVPVGACLASTLAHWMYFGREDRLELDPSAFAFDHGNNTLSRIFSLVPVTNLIPDCAGLRLPNG